MVIGKDALGRGLFSVVMALYFLFCSSSNILYASESSSPSAQVVVPANFQVEVGFADSVAVGSNTKGELEAWRIGDDGKLYRYDNHTLSVNPWVGLEAKDTAGNALVLPLSGISISSDGVMCVLDAHGKAYMYDWGNKAFSKMQDGTGNEGLTLEFISVGNKDNIWAVDGENKNILQHTATGWKLVQRGEALYVAAGVDGTVIALNEKGEAYRYLGDNKWDDLPGVILTRVALGDRESIWGVGPGGELYTYARMEMRGELSDHEHGFGQRAETQPQVTPPIVTPAEPVENRWGKKRVAKKQAGKKGARKKAGKKGAQKKAGKKAARKAARAARKQANAAVVAPAQVPVTVTTAVQDKGLNTHASYTPIYRWIRLKSQDGFSATGWSEVAVNAARTVFVTDVNKNVYHKGDRGYMVTKMDQGVVEGKPVEAIVPPGKMTRRQAKAAGKIDIVGAKKRQGRARRSSKGKGKRRLVKKTKTTKRARLRKENKKKLGKKAMNKTAVAAVQ